MHFRSLAVALSLSLLACSTGRQSTWEVKPTENAKAEGPDTFESLAAQGDEAWKKRDDKASVEAAIAAWEKAVALKPDDAATLAKLSHGYYFLADAHLRNGDKELYLGTFEKGVGRGEAALAAANPKFKEHVLAGGKVEDGMPLLTGTAVEVEAAYWYAASLGKWARAKGFAVTLGNKDRIRAVMTRVLELDTEATFGKQGFFHGAVDRYFGSFYAVAPGFAGGDMDKSKAHFEKSLEKAPYYPGTRVLYADTWATKKGDRALFDKLLGEVLAAPEQGPEGTDLAPEIKVEKEKARELQAQAGERF
jgi:tetratricopeptide (TPR) repeat protein